MTVPKLRLAGCLIAIPLALAVALFWPGALPTSNILALPVSEIRAALETDYRDAGLVVPADLDDYYSSVTGSVFRCLKGKVKLRYSVTRRPACVQDVRIAVVDTPRAYVLKADGGVLTRKWLVLLESTREGQEMHIEKLPTGDRTMALLDSIGRGTYYWTGRVHRADAYLIRAESDPVPAIHFQRPARQQEVREYWLWLERMVGSLRLRDDWGHSIRLSVESGPLPLLVSSSAGPDGRWGTKDDMIVKRDMKTGRIVQRGGLDQAPYGMSE